ncbi:ankyrin-3-like isoform X1 [Leptopilina heterotoma]|uniref:ankyrin-3-like isoform X1 n=1 Tax=Leptopilina heterotoma TaxID=63436 RepID=UPI001CA839C7|nr:ankyrin-3-like isoform X1 [Leptopilina heterotoma]
MDSSNNCSDPSDGSDPLVSPDHVHKLNLIQAFLKHYSDKETESGGTSMPTAEEQEEMVLLTAKRDRDGNSLLHLAIKENQTEVFNQIVGECNVDAENNRGERPLHCAAADSRIEFALALIENGATVNVEDNEGKTPLHLALKNQNVLLAEILFDSRAVMTEEYINKFQPLHCAAESGNLEIVKLLMTNGCKTVDSYGGIHDCPLKAAVNQGHLEVVKYLMRKGDKHIKTITEDRCEILMYCVKPDRAEILKYLVDVGMKTDQNYLGMALNYKCYNVWKYLMRSTSKMNASTCCQETELHSAIRAGQVETVKIIINNPANYYRPDSLSSQLAVHIAVENGDEDILEVLLNRGFPSRGCFEEIKPLHVAATFDNTRLVELLLKSGADINSTADNITPLYYAACAVQPNVVKFLLEKGADPSKRCCYGSSPLEFALDMLTGRFGNGPTITTVTYEKLLKVMEILIPKVKVRPDYWHYAIKMKFSRIKSDLNTYGQTSKEASKSKQDVSNLQFQLAMIKVIFNYLKEDQVESLSLSALNGKEDKSIDSPELLQIVMEYNDCKSCSDIEIRLWKNSYECNLLLIGYADSVKNLTNIDVEFKNDVSYYKLHGKDKTVFLKLIVARLVLIIDKYNSKVSTFCRKHNLNDWRKECGKQKVSLQNTKVDENFDITFYDVLTSPVSKFATFTGNENFLQSIASSYTKFPAYAEFLKVSLDKGKIRNDLMDDCVNHMFNLVARNGKIRISKSDVDQIFQYLSVFDLRRFSAACAKKVFRL